MNEDELFLDKKSVIISNGADTHSTSRTQPQSLSAIRKDKSHEQISMIL